ncbi:MAG: 16S rRNA (adenine(1518)-N(6)/adenine(1519)-N(6))-dimethyltransferase RsmA [Treponemataceae bacterium]
MSLPCYDSPLQLKNILDSRNMSMQKKFGQNFLINSNARLKLADSLEMDENTFVWEVGPGLGALTVELLKKSSGVTAFEIDRGFAEFLKQEVSPEFPGKLKIVEGDFIKTWKTEIKNSNFPQRFFGNLPYNVAALIIADLISNLVRFEIAVVTVQKEVAQRMCAKSGSKDYSSFSVLCQWAYDVKPVLDLSGGSFWPKPNVDSRAVKLIKKPDFPCCKDPAIFLSLIRILFSCRRKTIKNNLNIYTKNSVLTEKILLKSDIYSQIRAEKLNVEQLLFLSDCVYECMKDCEAKN